MDLRGDRRELWLLVALALAVALIVTGPAWFAAGPTLLGDPDSEAYMSLWVLDWAQRSLLETGLPPTFAPELNFPNGRSLHALDLVDALVTLPLFGAEPHVRHTAAVTFEVALSVVGSWLLLRPLARDAWSVVPAVVAFATTPYLLASIRGGANETIGIGWMPLTTWAVLRIVDAEAPRARAVLLAGALVGLTFMVNPYYLVFTALGGAWLVAARWRDLQLRGTATRLALISALGALVAIPQALAILATMGEESAPLPQLHDQALMSELFVRAKTQDVLSFVLPTDRYRAVESGPTSVYLGLVLLGGALLGFRRPGWRRWAGLAAVCGVFALGAVLRIGGEAVQVAGYQLALPASFLNAHVPPFTLIHHPFRIVPFVVLSLGALLVLGLDRLQGTRRAALCAAFTAAILVDQLAVAPQAWPTATASAAQPAFYRALGEDPESYGLLELHGTGGRHDFGPSLLYLLAHRKQVLFDTTPPDPPIVDNVLVRLVEQDVGAGPLPETPGLCAQGRELGRLGVRYLVKHVSDPTPDPRWDRIQRCGYEVAHSDGELIALYLDR